MIIEISVAIIALAFVALVIYLIALLRTLQLILGHVDQTFVQVRTQLGSFNPVFKAMENVGDILEQKTASLKEESNSTVEVVDALASTPSSSPSGKEKEVEANEVSRLADFFELIGVSIRLWQQLKKRR